MLDAEAKAWFNRAMTTTPDLYKVTLTRDGQPLRSTPWSATAAWEGVVAARALLGDGTHVEQDGLGDWLVELRPVHVGRLRRDGYLRLECVYGNAVRYALEAETP